MSECIPITAYLNVFTIQPGAGLCRRDQKSIQDYCVVIKMRKAFRSFTLALALSPDIYLL